MAAFRSRHRKGGRWWMLGATVAVALVALLLVSGAMGTLLPGSSFDTSNGGLTSSANHDWNPAGSPSGNVGPVQTITCGTTFPSNGTNCALDWVGSSSDNAFGQGTKEDSTSPTIVTGSIPPQKDDLSRFYINQEKGSNGDNFLYLAWERTNLLGSAHMDFELNQKAQPDMSGQGTVNLNRTAGDVLIDFDFGGSGPVVLSYHTWLVTGTNPSTQCAASNSFPCWSAATTLNASVAIASVNNANVNDYNPPVPGAGFNVLSGSTSNNGTVSSTFGEAGIDLQAAGIFPPNVCEHFGDAWLKSRSSGSSFTSEMKDFIAPLPVNISNCETIVIKKRTVPRGVNHDFGFHNVDIPASAVFSHALDGNGNFTLNDNGNTGNNDSDANTQTITNVPAGGPYHVTEADPTPGFDLTGVTCSPGGSGDVSTRTATITVSVGQTVTCTFTNTQRGAIKVVKVTNPSSDTTTPFGFTPVGFGSGNFTLRNGDGGQTFGNLVPTTTTGGPYSVSETTIPSGWILDPSNPAACDNGTPGSITVLPGQTTTCTFYDLKLLGAIKINKSSSKSGAPLQGGVFDISTDPNDQNTVATVTTDANGVACKDNLGFAAGGTPYYVTEKSAPSGYAIDTTGGQPVVVSHNSTCGDGNEAVIGFTDTPLTNVVVTSTSQVANGTKSTISCVDSHGNTVGTSVTTPTDPAQDNAPNLEPGTYTCTVVIDP